MINAFEFQPIRTSRLPAAWKAPGALDDLERFLQENWELRNAFYSDLELTKRQRFIDFDRRDGFKTKNYIGTIQFRGERFNIFPKIYKTDEDDYDTSDLATADLMKDLVLWLEYCNKFNFPFVAIRGDLDETDSFLELLITVYVRYVKTVVDRQLFFRYEDVTEDGEAVKGKIDFSDYASKKYPTGQLNRLRYTYSAFVFDNLLNQIIKHTCRLLYNVTTTASNKRIIRDILMKLGDVSDRSCQPYDCDTIKLNSLQSSYATILSMSKMFLLNKVSVDSLGISDSFCFLFPAELLFEGFIAGFLKETLGSTAKVTAQSRKLYLAELEVDGKIYGNRFQLKEDIVVERGDAIVVLDTKYKEIDRLSRITEDSKRLGIEDEDMRQMAVYANRRGAKKMYLLYPLYRGTEPDNTKVVFNILDGPGDQAKKIPLQILQVPFSLCDDIEGTKALLTGLLDRVIQ